MAASGAVARNDRPTETDNRRRWCRYALGTESKAVLLTEAGEMACVIDNISLTGAKLRVPADSGLDLKRGMRLRLLPAEGPGLDGHAAWCEAGAVGVAFAYSDPSVQLTMTCLTAAAAR